jgi:hypothetical protein
MPGFPFLTDSDYAASLGYAQPDAAAYQQGPSHTSFVVWLIVYALAAVLVVGGLKAGGFSFVFRNR